MVKDKELDDKISKIFESYDDLEYYKEVVQYIPIGKPVWSYWVTSQYGSRSDPFNGKRARHKGMDLASRTGNKIKVKAKGKVTRAEYAGGYGNLVVVDHGNGFQTKYAHMNKIYVKKDNMWSMMKHWERLAQPDVLPARIFIMKFCIWEKTSTRCRS